MIECNRLPADFSVAIAALPAEALLMNVLYGMAIIAFQADVLVVLIDMAIAAGDLGMLAAQRETRLAMFERTHLAPSRYCVTALAGFAEIFLVGIVFLVAIETGCRRLGPALSRFMAT